MKKSVQERKQVTTTRQIVPFQHSPKLVYMDTFFNILPGNVINETGSYL